MGSFKQFRKEAWTYYKTWMREKTYCKLLKQEILVTRKGWDHLIKGKRGRNLRDSYRRLKLLKMAKHIITKADKYAYEKREGQNYLILTKNFKKNNVRVVLKKNKDGKYYFFSVMDK